jgi:hypothetical protein
MSLKQMDGPDDLMTAAGWWHSAVSAQRRGSLGAASQARGSQVSEG